jgi:methylmalonyl-CoA mutase C-terminal domain/subunit
VILFAGGIIPQEDIVSLRDIGFQAIFGPGASTNDIVDWVRANVHPRQN